MRTNAERAELYRQRADQLRALADNWAEPDTRGHVLAAALFYDDMAAELERTPDVAASIARIARKV